MLELKVLEADKSLVKLQMTILEQQSGSQNAKTPSQNTKTKMETPNTVPIITLQINHCRSSKDEGHIAKKCPKLAQRQKKNEDPKTLHQNFLIETTLFTKNPTVTLEELWKTVNASGN